MALHSPYFVASLPKPLDEEVGLTYSAPVWGFRGSKKVKKHEIVTGVDGEGITIHNVSINPPPPPISAARCLLLTFL